jgi:hypothetical protein
MVFLASHQTLANMDNLLFQLKFNIIKNARNSENNYIRIPRTGRLWQKRKMSLMI